MSTPSDKPRQPKGVKTGGQYAASAHAEAEISLDGLDAETAGAETTLAHRLAAFERLKDIDSDGTVSTLAWPEEPNEDGTFDVGLNVVYDANDVGYLGLGGQSAEPAGWIDADAPDGYRTAYDEWREDPQNPASDIDLDKMHTWYADHLRDTAAQRLDDLTTTDENGNRWAETEADWHEAEKARLDAQNLTPYVDLKPRDRFVIEQYDHNVECEVLTEPSDAEDRFGRPMKNIEIRRLDTGASGLHMYGPGGIARKVERPVHLRVDPDNVPSERDLNEAWGV